MTNYFTPDDFQDLKKQKIPKTNSELLKYSPSDFTMKIIFGYSAALQILKSNKIGKIEIVNN